MFEKQVVRPVGTIGLWNTARHSLGLYRCVINTSRYLPSVPIISTEHMKSMIQTAVATVVRKHEFLCVGIIGEDTNKPLFVHVPEIDIGKMVQWTDHVLASEAGFQNSKDTEDLLRSLEYQHDQLWENLSTQPGWRLAIRQNLLHGQCQSLDISLCFHHAYMDGKSSYIFHRDLLEALNNVSTADNSQNLADSTILDFPNLPSLPPAAERLIPFRNSSKFIMASLWQEILKDAITPSSLRRKQDADTVPWTGEPMSPINHKANLRCVRIANAKVCSLLAACKEHNATLTGLLHALVFTSLAFRLSAAQAPCFQSACPISLSRCAKPPFDPENMLHCLVTSNPYQLGKEDVSRIRHAQSTTTETLDTGADADAIMWEIATKVANSLREKVARLPQDDIISLMSWIPDWRQFFMSKYGKKRTDTFEVSNLGSMSAQAAGYIKTNSIASSGPAEDMGIDSRWRIDRAIFSQGAMPVGPAFALNVAGVEGEELWITVNWQQGAVETGLVEMVVDDLQRWADAFPGTKGFWAGSMQAS